MQLLERLTETVAQRQARVVLPEMEDPRIAAAAEMLAREGIAVPVPLSEASDALAQALIDTRGMKPALARRMIEKPIVRAAAMVAVGEADALVAGAVTPTRRVIEAASFGIGLREGIGQASSFFVMVFPDGRELIFSDCAATVAPDAAALADIAVASARSAHAILGEARIAMLSYSTGSSGTGASVDLVADAARRAAEQGVRTTGPVQADAALNPGIAAAKRGGAGDANVLVFPSLDAGNIAYKLAQELAGAQAIGPLLQGFRKPVCDLSRGARTEDIVAATILTLALS